MFRGDREEGQGGPALQGDRPVKPRVQLEEPSVGVAGMAVEGAGGGAWSAELGAWAQLCRWRTTIQSQ